MATTCTMKITDPGITLPAPRPGSGSVCHLPSDGIQTGAGHFGYAFGAAWWETELIFSNVSTAQIDAFDVFYTDTVRGMSTSFTYTDATGESHTARFLDEPTKTILNRQLPGQFELRVRIRTSTKVT